MAASEARVTAPAITIRRLTEQDEFRDAVRLQKEIWQFEDVDLLPVRLFVVAGKVGGQVFGAYDGREMVGFALAIPGIKPGYGAYLHSHMVGVSAAYRNAGIGRLLKLDQRKEAIARGIELMEWTFDPLQIKNAHFNVERLGAVIRRYVRNQYGITSSALQGGLPTDRCTAEWWMKTDRVRCAIEGKPFQRPETEARISVPVEIAKLLDEDQPRARQIQARVTDEFIEAFDRGLAVVGFDKSDSAGTYLLGRWQ